MGNTVDRTRDHLAECIDAAQAAAFGSGTWETLLERMALAFPGTKVAITSKQLQPLRSIGVVTYGYEQEDVRDYEEHYARINPWTPHWKHIPPLRASASDDVFPSSQFKQSEFYELIERVGEAESASGVKLFEDRNSVATLSLHYGTRQADKYNIEIPRFLDALTPSLKLAVQLSARMAALSEPTSTLERAVHQFQNAAFLIDHSGALLDANLSGRDLIAEGQTVRCQSDRLWIVDDVARFRLDAIAQTDGPVPRLDGDIRSDWRLFEFSSADLDRRVAWIPAKKKWILAVFEPAVAQSSIVERAQSFGLTRQEAKVAAALVDGLRVDAIANAFGISSATVRQHLKATFAKTDTHRQAELIAKLIGFRA